MAALDPVKISILALKQVQTYEQYKDIADCQSPEIIKQAWEKLSIDEQSRISKIVHEGNQPVEDSQSIAKRLKTAKTLVELQAIKIEVGQNAVTSAWSLLDASDKLRIHSLADTSANKAVEVEKEEKPKDTKPEQSHSPILWPLSEKIQRLSDLLEPIDLDSHASLPQDAIIAIDVAIMSKDVEEQEQLDRIDSYCSYIKSLEYYQQARKAESDRLRKLAESDQIKIDYLKSRLKMHLDEAEKRHVKTDKFTVRIRKAGGHLPVRLAVQTAAQLPTQYQKVTIEPDKTALREAIESGDPEVGQYAYLGERSEYVSIQ